METVTRGPIEWPAMDLEIPTTSPAAVAAPAYATWLDLGRAHHAVLAACTAEVGGRPLNALRRAARAEVLDLALSYTRALGVEVAHRASDLVLCTGHQPVLVHPGIWVKYLALARLVPPDGVGLNLIVDSDAIEEIAAEVPSASGRLRRERIVLARAAPEVPTEILPAPAAGAWQAFVAAIDARMDTLDEPEARAGWARARGLPPPAAGSLPGAVTAARRALEGPRPYLDLPVSRLIRTSAFRTFVLSIVRDAGRFAGVYNACLAAYREHYGIRTAAQPFPDLAIEEDRIELPFWYLADGRRWPLFIDAQGRRLVAGDREVGPAPGDPDDPGFARAPIRPRALTLTAFARLCVADLFIHGVGGGRYDRATDAIVRGFFGITPPAYATATATLFLPFAAGGPRDAERHRLQRLLLDLQHNPDRFLPPNAGPHGEMVAEKWSLIRRLEQAADLTRRERRAATQRIREINQILQMTVAGRVAEVQEALRHLDRHQEDAEVTGYRGYPFLLFPVESVDALVDLLHVGG